MYTYAATEKPPTDGQLIELLRMCRPTISLISEMQREYESALRRAPPSVRVSPVPWAELYERSFLEHLAIGVYALGLADTIKNFALLDGDALHTVRLKMLSGEISTSECPEGVTPSHVAGITTSTLRSLVAKQTYGLYLNELVARVRDFKDENSFLAAVRVDRSVLSCPTFSAYIAKAEMEGNQPFLGAVASAMKEPRKTWNHKKGPLKLAFQFLLELNAIDRLTPQLAYRLLHEETGLYEGKNGEPPDPASLWRRIQRWRSLVSTKGREEMSS